MKRTYILLAIAAVVLVVAVHHKTDATPAPTKPPVASKQVKPQTIGTQEVCSFNAPPCIKLVTPTDSYGLNDFRLYNRNCIAFVSLPDKVQRSYCGVFELKWLPTEST